MKACSKLSFNTGISNARAHRLHARADFRKEKEGNPTRISRSLKRSLFNPSLISSKTTRRTSREATTRCGLEMTGTAPPLPNRRASAIRNSSVLNQPNKPLCPSSGLHRSHRASSLQNLWNRGGPGQHSRRNKRISMLTSRLSSIPISNKNPRTPAMMPLADGSSWDLSLWTSF